MSLDALIFCTLIFCLFRNLLLVLIDLMFLVRDINLFSNPFRSINHVYCQQGITHIHESSINAIFWNLRNTNTETGRDISIKHIQVLPLR